MSFFVRWFTSKKLWLRYGIFSVCICLLLFAGYFFIYFPFFTTLYGGALPDSVLLLPKLTGHLYALFSVFVVPYGLFCASKEQVCTSWESLPTMNGMPWVMDGQAGYCTNIVMAPTASCANISGVVGFVGLVVVLCVAYFIIGASIGTWVQKRKQQKMQRHAE